MRILAVDFGTSNTVAALSIDGAAARLVSIDGSPLVPSAVFLADDGRLAVGRDAERQARIDPSRYEPNPKRRIDEGEVLLGQTVVPVGRLVSAVLGLVSEEVHRQLGGPPDEVRLTHPARWGERRRQVLLGAARAVGLGAGGPVLIPEPVAAATHFATLSGAGLAPGKQLAVYDLGGGTFDVAVVRRSDRIDGGYEVSAEAGLPDLGGVDFDQAIVDHIGRSHAREVDAAAWERLQRPVDAQSRRLQRALMVDVRDGKEALSRYPHTDIALPPPFTDVHLTRPEFEDLIRPNLGRSVQLLRQTIQNAQADAAGLAGIYLVGGSSRIPLVARLIQEELGVTPTTLDQPETSVATGALYLPMGADAARPAPAVPQPAPPPAYRPPAPVPAAPPPYSPPPTPPPGDRRRWRPRRLAVVLGVLLVAAGVTLVTLALRGGGNGHNSAKDRPSTSASSSSAPPVSIVPGAGTCTKDFQNCLDDGALRSYVQPTYGQLKSCKKNDAFGVSNLINSSGVAVATCQYANGYQILFVKVQQSDLSFYRDLISGSIASQSSLTKGDNYTWAKGQVVEFTEKPKGAGLYWDRSADGILGLAETTSDSLDQMRDWWKKNFRR
ncbi:MAG TPA: Hsp70 family protein [Mycobacteriales bacterium]|nr:Hsp70 family protein [Mycobacteriales bacterium]